MIARMSMVLEELGAFDHSIAGIRGPLVDLLSMLRDLNLGRNHPWAEPESFGGSGLERTAERERRIWAVTAVRVLRSGGFGLNESCRHVARALTREGHSGRQGAERPFPWETIKRWVLGVDSGALERIDSVERTFWGSVPCPHSPDPRYCQQKEGGPCLPIGEIALHVVAADDPLLSLITRRFNSARFG